MKLLFILVGLVVTWCHSQAKKSYSGYKLVEIEVTKAADVTALMSLQENNPQVEFWNLPKTVNDVASVAIPPDTFSDFTSQVQTAGLTFTVSQQDLQSQIDQEQSEIQAKSRLSPGGFDLFNYNRHPKINDYLDELVKICGEKGLVCKTFSIGNSYEGRPMKVIKIGSSQQSRPGLWIDAGIHAREWISPATGLIIANRLIYKYASDDETKKIVDNFDWYILPSANPDGYEFSWDEDRYWRKTRTPNEGSDCIGTDPNRNWDFHWRETGASSDPCDQTYAGPSAFSEKETQAISQFLLNKTLNFVMYISLHAYGQYWLTPWGYTDDLPSDYSKLKDLGKTAANAIRDVYGMKFTVGSASNVLYPASGSSMDWAKAVAGIDMSIAAELRDKGKYGFVLPAKFIKKVGRETWLGIRAMAIKQMSFTEKKK